MTDANLVLGRIDPEYFLGGAMALDVEAARQAVIDRIGTPLGLSVEHAADGIVQIAISDMAEAIRLSLFEKGLDPGDFALTSFGGAGGLHAALVGDELGSRRVLFPMASGTLSAWGMLFADIVQDVVRSRLVAADERARTALSPLLAGLNETGASLLERTGVAPELREYSLSFDMRYPGQGWEIGVDAPAVSVDPQNVSQAAIGFHNAHQALFAHADVDVVPEIVALKLRATGRLDKPVHVDFQAEHGDALKSERRCFISGAWHNLPVYERFRLAPGSHVDGPCIVEESHSTIVLPTGWEANVHSSGVLCADATRSETDS